MNASLNTTYGELELSSSNLLLESGALRVRGDWQEAKHCVFLAGQLRQKMGFRKQELGADSEAVGDFLSSTQCFLDASASGPAREALSHAQFLLAQPNFPTTRTDLIQECNHRVTSYRELEKQRREFLQQFGSAGHQPDVASSQTLTFLRLHFRSLFGEPLLHFAMYRQAELLGDMDLAIRHLAWAITFDPANSHLTALLGYQYLFSGNPERAIELGEEYLHREVENAGAVPVMLAHALTRLPSLGLTRHEQAIQLLRPFLAAEAEPARQRLAGLILLALLHRELGHQEELDESLARLDRLAVATSSVELQLLLPTVRQKLQVAENNGNGRSNKPGPLHESDRQYVLRIVSRLSLETIRQAA